MTEGTMSVDVTNLIQFIMSHSDHKDRLWRLCRSFPDAPARQLQILAEGNATWKVTENNKLKITPYPSVVKPA